MLSIKYRQSHDDTVHATNATFQSPDFLAHKVDDAILPLCFPRPGVSHRPQRRGFIAEVCADYFAHCRISIGFYAKPLASSAFRMTYAIHIDIFACREHFMREQEFSSHH